jgi:hypothetical protein
LKNLEKTCLFKGFSTSLLDVSLATPKRNVMQINLLHSKLELQFVYLECAWNWKPNCLCVSMLTTIFFAIHSSQLARPVIPHAPLIIRKRKNTCGCRWIWFEAKWKCKHETNRSSTKTETTIEEVSKGVARNGRVWMDLNFVHLECVCQFNIFH